jgi:hypothetical protein
VRATATIGDPRAGGTNGVSGTLISSAAVAFPPLPLSRRADGIT